MSGKTNQKYSSNFRTYTARRLKKSEAPCLDKFFTKYKLGTKFCCICLRTKEERRLAYNNSAVNAFAKAVNMDLNWQRKNICYICESKAIKALQFFRSMTFAAALDKIFAEILTQKQKKDFDVFEKKNFQNIVDLFGLGAARRAPALWEEEFVAVRKATMLKETKTLAFSVDGKSQEKRACPPKEIYLIPDDPPPDADNFGQVTDIVRSNPDRNSLPTRHTDHRNERFSNYNRYGHQDNMAEEDIPFDPSVLSSTKPGISETLVILDDDETNEQSIKIAKVESQAPQNPRPPPVNNTTPRLVPIEKLIERPLAPKTVPLEGPKEVFTGEGLLLTTPNGPSQLHPIAIKDGVIIVPSLDAQIVDGVLVYNNPIPEMNYQMYCVPNENRILRNLFIENERTKRDSPGVELATPAKKTRVLPQNEMDKSRIDWEDKIPMDVITFVDAIDPNRDPLIQTLQNAMPLKPSEKLRPHESPPVEEVWAIETNNVIDLC